MVYLCRYVRCRRRDPVAELLYVLCLLLEVVLRWCCVEIEMRVVSGERGDGQTVKTASIDAIDRRNCCCSACRADHIMYS